MKKLNNKGYLTVEVVLASVIAFGLAYFLLNLTIKVKDKNDDMLVKTILINDKAIIENNIMKDNDKYTSVELEECTQKKCTISFLSDTNNKLIYINVEGKYPKIECRTDGNLTFSKKFSKYANVGNININVVDNPKDNTGTVNIHSAIGYTESGETINLTSQNINVTVLNNRETNTETNEIEKPKEDKHEETKEFDKNVLKEIKSDLIKINIQKDIFEYTITINNDIEKLDLEPVAINESYKVEISNQEIATLEDNKINITITDDKGNKIDYIIKVNILKDISDVEIDDSDFKEKNTYKGKWIILVIIFSTILLFGLILTRKKK